MAGISKAERENRAAFKDAPQATIHALPYAKSDQAFLIALCAAMPFSGKPNAQGVISFDDRLEDAIANAGKILAVVAERGGQ